MNKCVRRGLQFSVIDILYDTLKIYYYVIFVAQVDRKYLKKGIDHWNIQYRALQCFSLVLSSLNSLLLFFNVDVCLLAFLHYFIPIVMSISTIHKFRWVCSTLIFIVVHCRTLLDTKKFACYFIIYLFSAVSLLWIKFVIKLSQCNSTVRSQDSTVRCVFYFFVNSVCQTE